MALRNFIENKNEREIARVSYFGSCKRIQGDLIVDVLAIEDNFSFGSKNAVFPENLIIIRFHIKGDDVKNEQIEDLSLAMAEHSIEREKAKLKLLEAKTKVADFSCKVKINKSQVFFLIKEITDIFSKTPNVNISAIIRLCYFVDHSKLLDKILKLNIIKIYTLHLIGENKFFNADNMEIDLEGSKYYDCLEMIAKRFFKRVPAIPIENLYISDIELIFFVEKGLVNFNCDDNSFSVIGNINSNIFLRKNFFNKLANLSEEQINNVCNFIESLNYHKMNGVRSLLPPCNKCEVLGESLFDSNKREVMLKFFKSFSKKPFLEIDLKSNDDLNDHIKETFDCIEEIFEDNKEIYKFSFTWICSSNTDGMFQNIDSKKLIKALSLTLIENIMKKNTSLHELRIQFSNQRSFVLERCRRFEKRNSDLLNLPFKHKWIVFAKTSKGVVLKFKGCNEVECLNKLKSLKKRTESNLKICLSMSINKYFDYLAEKGKILSHCIEYGLKENKDDSSFDEGMEKKISAPTAKKKKKKSFPK